MVELVMDEIKFRDDGVQIMFEKGHLVDNGVEFIKVRVYGSVTFNGLNHGF